MSVKWLTYRQRMDADLDDAFRQPGAEEFFSEDYIRRLSEPIKQLDDSLIKLSVIQFAILGFLAVEFVSSDATFSLFGLSVKNAPGLKEFLLAFSATVAIAIGAITGTRDTTVNMIQGISQRTANARFGQYAAYALPIGFNLRLYLPLERKRGQFSTGPAKLVTVVIALLVVFVFLSTLVASAAIHWMILKDIWTHPTLGPWSYFALTYVVASYLLNLLILLKRLLPFPYDDKSELKRRVRGPWSGKK
ncbi:hypothetical protein [Bradyrhizobium genosp. P]|uniref:hypothetical protein n=1 Tax=Bradyrhizobium genosp. P TaxID=83641 RepID=UPI003CEC1640